MRLRLLLEVIVREVLSTQTRSLQVLFFSSDDSKFHYTTPSDDKLAAAPNILHLLMRLGVILSPSVAHEVLLQARLQQRPLLGPSSSPRWPEPKGTESVPPNGKRVQHELWEEI